MWDDRELLPKSYPTAKLKTNKKNYSVGQNRLFLARFFLRAYSLENANSLVTDSPDWRTSSKLCTAPAVWKPNPWPNPGIGWEQPQVLKGFHGYLLTRRRCRVFLLQLVNVLVRVQLVTHFLQLLHTFQVSSQSYKWTRTKYPKAMGIEKEGKLNWGIIMLWDGPPNCAGTWSLWGRLLCRILEYWK